MPAAMNRESPAGATDHYRPACPGLYATSAAGEAETVFTPAQLQKMDFHVECHLSTAFVTVNTTWVVPGSLLKSAKNDGKKGNITFAMPVTEQTTVTGVSAQMSNKRFASGVMPNKDTKNMKGTRFGRNTAAPLPAHPELFAISIPGVPAGETVHVQATYFTPLDFENGAYVFRAPTRLPTGCISPNTPLTKVLSVMATARSAYSEQVQVMSPTHPVTLVQAGAGVTQVQLDPIKREKWQNTEFVMVMPVWGGDIAAAGVQQPPAPGDPDRRHAFAIAIAPPKPEAVNPFPRDVIFLLDRSGSMGGGPMDAARAALIAGLKDLTPNDRFNICAFDNLQIFFDQEGLTNATNEAKDAALRWVNVNCQARGTTDIMTPLARALELFSAQPNPGAVPMVFVITDGAVEDEREICTFVERAFKNGGADPAAMLPRVNTFGIGRYANHYFLKMLAGIGRGMNGAAYSPETVEKKMFDLLRASKTPILTNIAVGIPQSAQGVEILPFPVPDLFAGAPVMISGKCVGGLPATIEIQGRVAGGAVWQRSIPVALDLQNNALSIPLDKVFVKQRIDLMTARAWLTQEKHLEQQVIDLSLKHGVPCAHTKLCAFEISLKNETAMKNQKASGGAVSVAKYAVGGAAGVMVIGAMAGGFGDVGASLSNAGGMIANAGSMIGSIDIGGIDVPDLSCIAECAADAPCIEPIMGCVEPLMGCVEPLVGAAGECLEPLIGAVGSVVEVIGNIIGGN